MWNETESDRYFDHFKSLEPEKWQLANDCSMEIDRRISQMDNILNQKMFEFDYDEGDQSISYFIRRNYKVSLKDWISKKNTYDKRPFSLMQSWMKQLLEALQYLFRNSVIIPSRELDTSRFFIANENNEAVLKLQIQPTDVLLHNRQSDFSDIIRSVYSIAVDLFTSFPNDTEEQRVLKENFLDCIIGATKFEHLFNNDFLRIIHFDETTPENFFNSELFVIPELSLEERLHVEDFMQSIDEKLSKQSKKNLEKLKEWDSTIENYFIEAMYRVDGLTFLFHGRKEKNGPLYSIIRKTQERILVHILLYRLNKLEKCRHPGIIPIETYAENPPKGWFRLNDQIIKLKMEIRNLKKTILEIFGTENGTIPVHSNQAMNVNKNVVNDQSKFKKDFVVEKTFGSNGFGKVYKAESKTNGVHYAVKHITIENTDEARKKIGGEAEILIQLKHAGIIRCFDTWYENPGNSIHLYIVMQLCDEKTLYHWISENKTKESRPLDTMKNWIKQLAEALSYLHGKGFIHRDVKPSNILFALDNNKERTLKLGNFELAKSFYNSLSPRNNESGRNHNHTKNIGTSAYMAPEQLLSGVYNEKVDIFALGLVATELIIPFKQQIDAFTFFTQLREGRPDCLSEMPEARVFLLSLISIQASDRLTAKEVADHFFLKLQEERLENLSNVNHVEETFTFAVPGSEQVDYPTIRSEN